MATFPSPPFSVPRCLTPWHPRHCLLVAYWAYCCPTALKYYLYRADPTLYQAALGGGILKTLTVRAYRNLYLCLPLTIAMVSVGLSLMGLLCLPVSTFSWPNWFLGLAIGNVIGLIFLVIFGITFSFTASTARGAASGAIIGLVAGVANAAVLAVVLGMSPDWSYTQLLLPKNISLVLLFGLVLGTPVSLMLGGLIGGLIGIVTGLVSGLIAGTVFGIVETAVHQVEISGLAYATIIGLATSGAFGSSMTMASCLMFCLAVGGVVGISVNIALYQDAIAAEKAIVYGAISTLIIWSGTLRLMPVHVGYLLYGALSLLPGKRFQQHPIAWDELIILPLPGTQQYLEKSLQRNEAAGWNLLLRAARNPLQRPIVQQAMTCHLAQHKTPLRSIYRWLQHPAGDAYIFAPVDANDWAQLPTSREVLLGELSSQWVNCTSERTSYWVERFMYGVTWLGRNHVRTAQLAFCQLLYDMAYGNAVLMNQFQLSAYAAVYTGLAEQPGQAEIRGSLNAIATFLSYTHISQLSAVRKLVEPLPTPADAIRADVLDVLNALKQIAEDVAIAENKKSLFVRQGSLLRANSALEALRQQINHTMNTAVPSPEFRLLQTIVEQWSDFVTQAGGEAGQQSQANLYLQNPYIIGTPVVGEALFGRDDILKRIADELFTCPGQCPSIVLYGHRRMGKSSILRNLDAYLKNVNIKVVDFNMQILGHISDTRELLYVLAQQIYRSLTPTQTAQLSALERDTFIYENPYHALNSFFQTLTQLLDRQSFIIAIDEFEKIEEKIEKGHLSENLLEFLRGLTQSYPWFSLIFAGLHTLEEMCYSYWHPFFTSIPIRVSFLPEQPAQQLIMQANHVAYEDDVVAEIVRLTNGQPYLIQLIGHTLVTYFNRNLLARAPECDDYCVFNTSDLKAVLNSDEFYSIGSAYFKGIWLQASKSSVAGQVEILRQLARSPMSAEQLVQATGRTPQSVRSALEALQAHDVIVKSNHLFTYTVELMRLWIVSHHLSP